MPGDGVKGVEGPQLPQYSPEKAKAAKWKVFREIKLTNWTPTAQVKAIIKHLESGNINDAYQLERFSTKVLNKLSDSLSPAQKEKFRPILTEAYKLSIARGEKAGKIAAFERALGITPQSAQEAAPAATAEPESEKVEVESHEEEKLEQLQDIPQPKKSPVQVKREFIEDFLPQYALRYDEKEKKVLSDPSKEEGAKRLVDERTRVIINLKLLLNNRLIEEADAFAAKIQQVCPGTDLAKTSSEYVEYAKMEIQKGKEQSAALDAAAHAAPLHGKYKEFVPFSNAFFRKDPREDLREGQIALYQIGGRVFVVSYDRPLGQDRQLVESLDELKTYLNDPRLRKPS